MPTKTIKRKPAKRAARKIEPTLAVRELVEKVRSNLKINSDQDDNQEIIIKAKDLEKLLDSITSLSLRAEAKHKEFYSFRKFRLVTEEDYNDSLLKVTPSALSKELSYWLINPTENKSQLMSVNEYLEAVFSVYGIDNIKNALREMFSAFIVSESFKAMDTVKQQDVFDRFDFLKEVFNSLSEIEQSNARSS